MTKRWQVYSMSGPIEGLWRGGATGRALDLRSTGSDCLYTADQLQAQCSVTSMGSLYLFH